MCTHEQYVRALGPASFREWMGAETPELLSFDLLSGRLVLERARVADRLGQREVAAGLYHFVADLWKQADPELQRYVAEARDRMERLSERPSAVAPDKH